MACRRQDGEKGAGCVDFVRKASPFSRPRMEERT
jgi:hypothetical protein